jgi:hypothetical protein
VHKAKGASPVLKACRGLKEKRAIRALRVLTVHKARGVSPVPKALRVFQDHRGNAASLVLKALRDPQGQREIPQIPDLENRIAELEKRFTTQG